MKRKNLLKTLLSLPLLLASCESQAALIIVEKNIDYMLASEEKSPLHPVEIDVDDFLCLKESKQNFVLYFYSPNCETCQVVSNKRFPQFLANNPISCYQLSATNFEIKTLFDKYPNEFDETPKVMLYKEGEMVSYLNNTRYNDGRAFESSLIGLTDTSNVFTATLKDSITYFEDNNDEYLIVFKNSKVEGSYQYFSENIRETLLKSQKTSLILEDFSLQSDAKNYLAKQYNITNNETFAIYKNKTSEEVLVFNYLTESNDFISLLKTRF